MIACLIGHYPRAIHDGQRCMSKRPTQWGFGSMIPKNPTQPDCGILRIKIWVKGKGAYS